MAKNTQKNSKKSSSRTNTGQSRIGVATLAHSHYIHPWQVIVFIVLVMFAGIIIIRLSHAATNEVLSTPLSETELQQLPSASIAPANNVAVATTDSQAQPAIPVNGTVLFSYTPIAVAGVEKVGFYVDGKLSAVSTKRPYNFTFDSTRYQNGSYTLLAVALDGTNKPLAAVKKVVTVNNDLSAWQRAQNLITYPFYVLTAKP